MAEMCVFKNGSDVCVSVQVCLQVYVQCVSSMCAYVCPTSNTYTCTVLIFASKQDY